MRLATVVTLLVLASVEALKIQELSYSSQRELPTDKKGIKELPHKISTHPKGKPKTAKKDDKKKSKKTAAKPIKRPKKHSKAVPMKHSKKSPKKHGKKSDEKHESPKKYSKEKSYENKDKQGPKKYAKKKSYESKDKKSEDEKKGPTKNDEEEKVDKKIHEQSDEKSGGNNEEKGDGKSDEKIAGESLDKDEEKDSRPEPTDTVDNESTDSTEEVEEKGDGKSDEKSAGESLDKDEEKDSRPEPTDIVDTESTDSTEEDPISAFGDEETPLVGIPSMTPSDAPSIVPSLAPSGVPSTLLTGASIDGFKLHACDPSVTMDESMVEDITVNYYYNLIPETNQNGVLSIINTIEDKLLEAVKSVLCNERQQRNLATAVAVLKLLDDFPIGGCGEGCHNIAGQMTLRTLPEGGAEHQDLRCLALQTIHDEIQSLSFTKDIEGVKTVKYMPAPRDKDRNCKIGTNIGPQRLPNPSDDGSDGSSNRRGGPKQVPVTSNNENGDSSSRRTASVVSAAVAGISVLTLGVLCARRRSGCCSSEGDTGSVNSEKLYTIQTLSTNPSADTPMSMSNDTPMSMSNSYYEDNCMLNMPLSPRPTHDADPEDDVDFDDVQLDSPKKNDSHDWGVKATV